MVNLFDRKANPPDRTEPSFGEVTGKAHAAPGVASGATGLAKAATAATLGGFI